MRYLLDTSALIAHHRREVGATKVQELFDDPKAEILLASVSLTEFARRLLALGADEDAMRDTLEQYTLLMDGVMPVDEGVARKAVDVGVKTPGRLPLVDAFIAATALSCGACLVHRDAHFTAVPSELVPQLYLG